MNNEQLSRAVAEKVGGYFFVKGSDIWMSYETSGRGIPMYATDWSLIGPEIEKRKHNYDFRLRMVHYAIELDEQIPRAACLAILEE